MFEFMSVEQRESKCYDYFHKNNITNRDELRKCWKTNPIAGVRASFVEDMFSDFQELKRRREKCKNVISTGTDYQQTFVLSDIHIPFQDDETLRNVFDCIVNNQPKNIVLCGDILDCYSISKFCKRPDRTRNLRDEIAIFYKLMKELKKEIPNTEIHYVLGNHEARLEKLVLENPGLFGLKELSPQKLFRLDELGIYYHKTKVVLNDFIYYHGDVVRKESSYSAKQECIDHKLKDGISGHCFSEDVEILTDKGWKRVIDTEIGERVATIGKNSKSFEWNEVRDKFVYDNYKELYKIKTDDIDLMITDKHGLLGYNKDNHKFEEFDASDLAMTNNKYDFLSGAELNNLKGINLSEAELRLIINICANAYIDYKEDCIYWEIRKESRITHLKSLLNKLDIPFKEYHLINGTKSIKIERKHSLPIILKYFNEKKLLPNFLKNVNKEQAKIIMDEYKLIYDYLTGKENECQLLTVEKEELDLLQEIFAKNGMKFSYIETKKFNDKKNYYQISIDLNNYMPVSREDVTIVPYKGKVSCLSVDNGTLIVRSKGKTVVTQNTHRGGLYHHTYDKQTTSWYENGCLCKIEPDYLSDPDKANWQHCFTIVDSFDGTNIGTQVLIKDHKFCYGGKLYK